MTADTPPVLERLGPGELRTTVTGYRDALRAHQETLNRLNVYPVPDGDTGTNMALTMESVVAEVTDRTAAADGGELGMAELCQAVAHGALMGARGNSGVILSQIVRRLAEGLDIPGGASGPDLASALRAASTAAYEAVMRPVEGTILTVVRAASNGALAASAKGKALVDVLVAARSAASYSLERTPELLPVLARAGVVDAGGAGFVLLLDVMLNVVAGRPVPAPPPAPVAAATGARSDTGASRAVVALEGPRYEVMFLLEAPDEAIEGFKEAWDPLGDSIVVVGGDGLWNCHIHADDIGAAVEAALERGRPRKIRVTDLAEQVAEETFHKGAAADVADPVAAGDAGVGPAEPARCSVVAVGSGEGLARIMRSLGVDQLVAGGQSMNPSTGQILEAVEAAGAAEVIVLPNNGNVIPAAEQVVSLTTKTVQVVRTTGVAEGLAALMAYDPQASADQNAGAMSAAADHVVVGEVTRAVRVAATDAGPVEAGDFLGISRAGIEVVRPTVAGAATALLERLVSDEHELVTLIEGEGSSDADTGAIAGWLADHRPGVAVEVHHGGQPLYSYLLSAE